MCFVFVCIDFMLTLFFQSSRLMTQLEDFAQQNGVGVAALKNVIKSLIALPNCKWKLINYEFTRYYIYCGAWFSFQFLLKSFMKKKCPMDDGMLFSFSLVLQCIDTLGCFLLVILSFSFRECLPCVCVCMCVCVCVCVCTCACACVHVCVHACMCVIDLFILCYM